MSKRYRLKKDSPDSKAGTILTQDADSDYEYIANGGYDSFYYKDQVENSPDWFEEIKEPERIKVKRLQFVGGQIEPGYWNYSLYISIPEIPTEKYDKIKQAIEAVLNNDCFIIPKGHYMEDYLKSFYTQSDIDKAIKHAREAARDESGNWIHHPTYFKYYNLQSYLNSLKK